MLGVHFISNGIIGESGPPEAIFDAPEKLHPLDFGVIWMGNAIRKACPVVVRKTAGRLEVLAFRHPLAGNQLVKGSIEFAETVERAALRELFEEGGIGGTAIAYLGTHQMADPAQEWHFVVCDTDILPDAWTHRTSDGGGLDFAFFWHPLDEMPSDEWHPIFRDALNFIRRRFAC